MICPHCNSKPVVQVSTLSHTSSLCGQFSESRHVTGHTCLMCGHWIEPNIIPVCPMPRKPTNQVIVAPKMMHISIPDRLVWKHRKDITQLMRVQEGLHLVSAYLRKIAGVKILTKSVMCSLRRLENGQLERNLA